MWKFRQGVFLILDQMLCAPGCPGMCAEQAFPFEREVAQVRIV
jgi:hypothetical protein